MKTSIKNKWIKALRSREYSQTKGKLLRSRKEGDSFCCLGVLCELHAEATENYWTYSNKYLSHGGDLPPKVREWVGIEVDEESYLIAMNDTGHSFDEIANYIKNCM